MHWSGVNSFLFEASQSGAKPDEASWHECLMPFAGCDANLMTTAWYAGLWKGPSHDEKVQAEMFRLRHDCYNTVRTVVQYGTWYCVRPRDRCLFDLQ